MTYKIAHGGLCGNIRTKSCPHCSSSKIVNNGLTYYGRQNHKCKIYKRQFVEREPPTSLELAHRVKKLLLDSSVIRRRYFLVAIIGNAWL